MVTAELPGIEKEDVKIELIDQTLTIQSERNMEKKEEKEGFYQLRTQFRAVLSLHPAAGKCDAPPCLS